MTVAVCLECGAFKHGASTPCRKCRYEPNDDESYTKHLLITDHYLSREQLEEVADMVKRGEQPQFPVELLKQAWVSKVEVDKTNRRMGVGCLALLVIIVAVIAAVLAIILKG
jgi:hypothetical protein